MSSPRVYLGTVFKTFFFGILNIKILDSESAEWQSRDVVQFGSPRWHLGLHRHHVVLIS